MMLGWLRKAAPVERRASQTDAVIQALIARASGKYVDPGQVAAIETACSFYARAFAAAEVSGADFAVEALNPATLSMIARALIRDGECLLVISVDEMGGFTLLPAASWDVRGGPREAEWVYRVDFQGPSRTESVGVPSAGALSANMTETPAPLGITVGRWR